MSMKRVHRGKRNRNARDPASSSSSSSSSIRSSAVCFAAAAAPASCLANAPENSDSRTVESVRCVASASRTLVFEMQWTCMEEVACLPKDEAMLFGVLVREDEVHLRGRHLSDDRLADIEREGQRLGMSIAQALSLRRMMMRSVMGISVYATKCGGYGDQKAIDAYAAELESSVARLLCRHGIPYVDEVDQKKNKKKNVAASSFSRCSSCCTCPTTVASAQKTCGGGGGTPDFLIGEGARLYINGRRVNWIECKAFYGAAMFSSREDEKNVPVAKVKQIAQKYVAEFGPGAFVFRQGFNRHLRCFIANKYVTLLDATPLDLEEGPFMG